MKKILFLLLANFLVLAACGQEESKSEDKKETKSSDKESKKVDKKKEEGNGVIDESNEELATQNEVEEQTIQSEPSDKEKAEANAKVAKEHGYTGLPNGDSMSEVPVGQIELTPEELAEEESKPEYEDVVESEDESYDQKKEEELQKEYFELSDKMYGDEEHSDEEMEAMEKRQDEILDEVEPIY